MKTLIFVLFLATGPILSADIITSVTCNANGLPNDPGAVTDPRSCSALGPDQGPFGIPASASATASVNLSLANNPNSFSSLSVNQQTDTTAGYNNAGYPSGVSSARSQVSVNETLFTTGGVRPGFVQVSATGGATGSFRGGSGNWDLSLASIAVSCFVTGGGSNGTACVLWPNGAHSVPGYFLPVSGQSYPFTLGQAFNLGYEGSAGSDSYNNLDNGYGYANLQFQFRFFEADGTTQVAVGAVPEPGTFALLGAALGLLAVGKNKFLHRVRKMQ